MPTTTVYLKKILYEKAKKHKLVFSRLLKQAIIEELKKKGEEVKEEDPELILKVKCPYCGWIQNTTTVYRVKCIKCERKYRVFPKNRPSNIVEIVKGTIHDVYKRRRPYITLKKLKSL